MSMFYMANGRSWDPTLDVDKESRSQAKQAFKDECDINRIVTRMAKTGMVSHLSRFEGRYGDFTDYPDLLEASRRLARGKEIFDHLPIEIKREFGNDPGSFFTFVNDPENADRLKDVLPGLAQPGQQYQNPVMRAEASSPSGGDPVAPAPTPAAPVESPSGDA